MASKLKLLITPRYWSSEEPDIGQFKDMTGVYWPAGQAMCSGIFFSDPIIAASKFRLVPQLEFLDRITRCSCAHLLQESLSTLTLCDLGDTI